MGFYGRHLVEYYLNIVPARDVGRTSIEYAGRIPHVLYTNLVAYKPASSGVRWRRTPGQDLAPGELCCVGRHSPGGAGSIKVF